MEIFKYINMNKTRIVLFIIPALLIGINYSCMREEFDMKNYDQSIEWTPTFEGPIAYGNLSLNDLLTRADTSGMIFTDDSNQIIFAYADTLDQITAEDCVTIPGQEFKAIHISSPIDIPGGFPGRVDSFMIADDYRFVFNKGGYMDSMFLETGSLEISIHCTFRHIANLYLSSSNIFKENGDTLNEIIPVSALDGSVDKTVFISLNRGKLLLDNSDPDSSLMPLHFKLVVTNSGNPILTTDEVNILFNIGNIKLNSSYGWIGQYDTLLLQNQELNIDLFKGNFTGNVKFNDPHLNMTVHNSFGLHMGFGFENSYARMKDGTVVSLDINPDIFILHAPELGHEGESETTILSINRDGSNIDDIFSTDLEKLVYSVRISTNPPEAESPYNFLLKSSAVSVEYEFELPMNLRVKDLVLQDTINFDLGGNKQDSQLDINALQVRIETDNGMPVDVNLQVYFVDSAYQVLDSLFTDENRQILISGEVDPVTNRVTASTNNVSVIDVPQSKFDNILNAAFAFIQATVETTNNGQSDVKFYSDYTIGFKLATKIDLALKITEKGN